MPFASMAAYLSPGAIVKYDTMLDPVTVRHKDVILKESVQVEGLTTDGTLVRRFDRLEVHFVSLGGGRRRTFGISLNESKHQGCALTCFI